MKLHFTLGAAGLLALVAGCVEQLPMSKAPIDVTRQNGFSNVGLIGTEPAVVRTYKVGDGPRKEFAGADCLVSGPRYSAKFASPATLRLPDYGRATPAPKVQCTYNKQTRAVATKVFNRTEANGVNAAATGGGLIGGLIALAVVTERADKANDDYGFEPVQVLFE